MFTSRKQQKAVMAILRQLEKDAGAGVNTRRTGRGRRKLQRMAQQQFKREQREQKKTLHAMRKAKRRAKLKNLAKARYEGVKGNIGAEVDAAVAGAIVAGAFGLATKVGQKVVRDYKYVKKQRKLSRS